MAFTRFKILDEGRAYKHKFIVASGAAATIDMGIPTKAGSAGGIVPMVDANGTTSERFTGIAATVSTDTAAAAGEAYVWEPLPGMIYSGSPKAAGSCNTDAKIDALKYKRVIFDLTSTTWTVDTAASDGATQCVVITGGDYLADVCHFVYMDKGSYIGG